MTPLSPSSLRGQAAEVREWIHRAADLVPMRDRVELLVPPLLVAKFARYALKLRKHPVPADDLDARDPEFCSLIVDLTRIVAKTYFRLRVEGVENVPATGGALLVGNHNGGLLPTDGFFTALAIADHLGPERGFYALAHDFLFDDATLRRYALKLGMIRAGQGSAHRALRGGSLVLVYPGSDLDTFRPFRERQRVVLGGRTGFLELALREQVPIVPVVAAGTHEQFVVLSRGDHLARILHMHRWARTDVFPIAWEFPWGITSGFVPYLPLPAQTTLAFGEPFRWPELSAGAAKDERVLARCYEEVEARMQTMLDRLCAHRHVLLGQRPPHHPPS